MGYHGGLLCQTAMDHQGYAIPNSAGGRELDLLVLCPSSPCAVYTECEQLSSCWPSHTRMGAGRAREEWWREERGGAFVEARGWYCF